MKNAAFVLVCLLAAKFPIRAAAPHFFVTREAGAVIPIANPTALKQPRSAGSIAYDHKGNLYYGLGNQIWRLNADGTDTAIAGASSSSAKFVEGEPALEAPLRISDFLFDNTGDLYIDDSYAGHIYKVTPDGAIHTFAGEGEAILLTLPATGPNVPATSVPIESDGMAIDSSGNIYVESSISLSVGCLVVFSFPPDGRSSSVVATMPSGRFCSFGGPSLVVSGPDLFMGVGTNAQSFEVALPGGPGIQASPINTVLGGGIAVGPNGMIYRLGGGGIQEIDPQTFQISLLPNSSSVTGSLLIVNPVNGDVAVLNNDASVSVWTALTGSFQPVCCNAPAFSGDGGPATLAVMVPQYLATDSAGDVFLTDQYRIRKITPDGMILTIAGTGSAGTAGDQGPAIAAEIAPGEMAADAAHNLYFINDDGAGGATIRRIDHNGIISTVLGGGKGKLANGSPPTGVSFTGSNLAADAAGDIFFDSNSQVWELTSSGMITLVAGTGSSALVTNGTPALAANIGSVSSIAVGKDGTVYFGDAEHEVIYEIDGQGNLQILAGIFNIGAIHSVNSIPPGVATNVDISEPDFIQVDAQGNLYFYGNIFFTPDEVLRVDTSGNLTVVTGLGSGGEGGDASNAADGISGLAMDPSGNIYLADGTFVEKLSPYDPNNPPPYVSAGGVIGAGGSLPAVSTVSAGGEVSIFGANFVAAANARTVSNADLVKGKIPTMLAGVCASFGGSPAAMLGVYPNQLNVQVGTLAPGAVNVQVTTNCGTPQAVTSNYSGVVVQTASPEFYSFAPDPIGGRNPIAAVNGVTGAFLGPPNLLPGATFISAKAGDIVQAYATGFGATSPAYGLGVIPGAAGTLTNPYSLTLGGVPIPAANIAYAGISPCCAGFYQIDFTVPAGIPSGAQPLIITIAGQPSPPEAYIQLQ